MDVSLQHIYHTCLFWLFIVGSTQMHVDFLFFFFVKLKQCKKGFLGCGPPLLEPGCHSVQMLFLFSPPSAPEVSNTHRNNTNLFTRLGNVGYWRAEISRNHTERKKRDKLHQVGHDVWLRHRSISFFFYCFSRSHQLCFWNCDDRWSIRVKLSEKN